MAVRNSIVVKRDVSDRIISIDMLRPSNFHSHTRSDKMMQAVAYDIMRWVKYLLVMPNTSPSIDTVSKVIAYYSELIGLQHELGLEKAELIMTVYLTEKLDFRMVNDLAKLPFRVEVKYYPPHAGATTGSGFGIPLSEVSTDTFRAMVDCKMPVLGHFESVYDEDGRELPMAEREGHFMDHDFPRLRDRVPNLLICIEHASTAKAVERVKEDPSGNTVCGMTPHHLTLSIDDLMGRSWRNHGRCMPIPKGPNDVAACLEFATSGDPRVILGDDTAPHPSQAKMGPFDKAACGCWLPHSLAIYAHAFEKAGALDDRFVQFACYNGANWRGLELPDLDDRVMLVAETERDIPDPLEVHGTGDVVIPLGWTEEPDRWKIGLALNLSA